MKFRLTYRGELKANGDATHKHELRQHFSRQLADLWKQPPLARRSEFYAKETQPNKLNLSVWRGAYQFVPLVSSKLYAVAELECVLLRPGPPGELFRSGGDIDNRLKTLLDALKVPEQSALPKGVEPGSDETPFFCLLEDDKLITALRVETDRLLNPLHDREVALLVRVNIEYTELLFGNMGL